MQDPPAPGLESQPGPDTALADAAGITGITGISTPSARYGLDRPGGPATRRERAAPSRPL
ncbi:hypothetical protein [Streptomyces caatingaensis]|uniref:hypothetical protein n=1 Tax=Streptomyces caatingaensis TaxID=1678637 RepID=UPI000ABC7BFD|nr:hypothetical protein [Streptomyces caatingaensis]